MKIKLDEIAASVLSVLGIKKFEKNDQGKSVLTDDQKKTLTDRFGEKFVTQFSADLEKVEEESGVYQEAALKIAQEKLEADNAKNAKDLKDVREKLKAAEEEKLRLEMSVKDKDDQIAKLEKEPGDDKGAKVEGGEEVKKQFKPDMSISMNKFYHDRYYGRVSGEYSGNSTVDTQKLDQEFGKYVSSDKLDIIQRILIKTTSTAQMSTIMTDKTEVRATSNIITSVLQQFVPHWTPKGNTTFTPLTIKNYKHKINVEIIPADVMESILGYLYDENLKPEEMPIVKYILYQMVFPKLDEERETVLATGVFKENVVQTDGSWKSSKAAEAMDGYITQLCKQYLDKNTAVNFYKPAAAPTKDTIIDQIQSFSDILTPVYKGMKLPLFIDPDLLKMYRRAKRAKFTNMILSDDEASAIDDSKLSFVEIEGMRGTGSYFTTPQVNWKHVISQDPQSTKIRMETVKYEADILGEYWESTGFWIADAIFAYISDAQIAAYKTAAGVTTTAGV